MEVEKQFNLDGLGREESRKAKLTAEETLDTFEQDILPEMVNFYTNDGYVKPETILFDVVETVETNGVQFNGEVGGLHKGRDNGVLNIELPYTTNLATPIHELSHDIAYNTLDFEQEGIDEDEIESIVEDALNQKQDTSEDDSLDSIVKHTFQEAFCNFNTLFFGEITGRDFEKEIRSAAVPYSSNFENTFETLWEGINPEYVETRRTALENADGSLDAIKELGDEDHRLITNLEDQFLDHIEKYQNTPPVDFRSNFFVGKVPFIFTQASKNYQIPVNEDEDHSEEDREKFESMNETLSNYPEKPVAENFVSNSMSLTVSLGATERLGSVNKVEDWGEFVYGHIKDDTRGYTIGVKEDLDIAHTVGARRALTENKKGRLPNSMIEKPQAYFEAIEESIKITLGTWMSYTGVKKDLESLEKGSDLRNKAIDRMVEQSSNLNDSKQEKVKMLYDNDLSELESDQRHILRYAIEGLVTENNDEWFSDPYQQPF